MKRLSRVMLALLWAMLAPDLAEAAGFAPDPLEVRVCYQPVTGIAQLFVLQGEGWALRASMNLKLQSFENPVDMAKAMEDGGCDLYYGPLEPLLALRAAGHDVRVVAAAAVEERSLVAGPKLSRLLAGHLPMARVAEGFTQTEGHPPRIAVEPTGSVADTALRYYFRNVAGVAEDSVTFVPLPQDAARDALLTGTVDAAVLGQPALGIVQDRDPQITIIANGGQMLRNQPGPVMAVTGAFAAAHGPQLTLLVGLHVRATAFVRDEPARTAHHAQEILGADLYDLNTLVRAITASHDHYVSDPNIIGSPTELLQMFQMNQGTLAKRVSLLELFDRRYYALAATPAAPTVQMSPPPDDNDNNTDAIEPLAPPPMPIAPVTKARSPLRDP